VECVEFREVAKPKIQLDHQIQGDGCNRFVNLKEVVSERNKRGGCNIT
jgi:hypothetical protein